MILGRTLFPISTKLTRIFQPIRSQFMPAVPNSSGGGLSYHLSSKNSFFARYSYGQDNNTVTSLFTALPAGFASGNNVNHPRAVAAGYGCTRCD
jgi:hypothetical protein